MSVTAQQVFKEIESGKFQAFYLVVGEEPLQSSEILARFRKSFANADGSDSFNVESWDGEALDAGGLLTSLQMLPGLFSDFNDKRLIICQRFDKLNQTQIEQIDRYFKDPVDTTVFLIFSSKVDRRKSWTKIVEEKGSVIEIREPYDREWPKWIAYFENKLKKRIEPAAWEMLVGASNRTLSLLNVELEKLSVYVGNHSQITLNDVRAMISSQGTEDVFSLAEDIVRKRKSLAMKKYEALLREGESDIKILAILVRQFRMVEQTLSLLQSGVTDNKIIAGKIGAHPFFVSKIIEQTKGYSRSSLGTVLDLLAEADYRLKTGDGNLFSHFLVPYFSEKIRA